MSNKVDRFLELWSYAKKNYPYAGNGIPWLENWVEQLHTQAPKDYLIVLPAYEFVMGLVRKSRGPIWGLDGWIEREILRDCFDIKK